MLPNQLETCVLSTLKLGFHMYGCGVRMRHAACGMRQQMAIVGIHRSDSKCADRMRFVVRIRMRQIE